MRSDGRASTFYIKNEGVPWHGLGVGVEGALTSAEAIEAAGMDWGVEKLAKIAYSKERHKAYLVPGEYAILRTDTEEIIGSVGEDYTPFANRDAFRFFDEIVGERLAVYHTAGVIGAGEKVWILAKLPESILVAGSDLHERYVALLSSHDGSLSVHILPTTVRVVCENTFNASLAGFGRDSRGMVIPHMPNIHARVDEVRRKLEVVKEEGTRLSDFLQGLSERDFTQKDVDAVVMKLLPPTLSEVEAHAPAPARLAGRLKLSELYESSPGNDLPGIRGTALAMKNAVEDFVDHYKRFQSPDTKLASVWFGPGRKIKERASSVLAGMLN